MSRAAIDHFSVCHCVECSVVAVTPLRREGLLDEFCLLERLVVADENEGSCVSVGEMSS